MAGRDDDWDKPKKSWSEIDKMRDGKRSGSAPPADRARLERSGTYSRYKSAADSFFSGELMPESLKEKLDPTGEAGARMDALRKLKTADDTADFNRLASEYLDKYETPEDPYLLDRMLAHPETPVVLQSLEKLIQLADDGELVPPKSLAQRLRSLELTADDYDVQDEAKRLARKLKSLAPR